MKKMLSLTLSVVMLLAFMAGCNDNTVTTDVGTMTKEEIKTFEEKAGGLKLPLTKNGTEITMIVPTSNINLSSTVAIKELSRRTGANIKILEIPEATLKQKVKVLMAGGVSEMPDVLKGSFTTQEINDYGAQGAYAAVDDHIKNMPNFKEIFFDKAKEYGTEDVDKSWRASDGKLYQIPSYDASRDVNHGMLYRKDIFDKHGIKMWNNPEEFYQALKQLKQIYPSSTPLVTKSGATMLNQLAASWGVQKWPGMNYNEKTGKWNYSSMEDEFKVFLDYMKKLYNEGLLDAEFLTATQPSWTSKMTQKDKAFVTYDWIGRLDMFKEQTKDTVPGYDLRYGNPVGPTQKVITLSKVGGAVCVANNKNASLTMQIMDYLLSEGGAELMTCGIEGVTYNLNEDGTKARYLGFEEGKVIGITDLEEKYGLFTSTLARRYDRRSVYFNYTEREQEAQDLMNNKEDGYLPLQPQLTYTEEEARIVEQYDLNLRKIGEEFAVKYILADDKNMPSWDKFISDMKSAGADKVLKAQNDAQKRYDAQ